MSAIAASTSALLSALRAAAASEDRGVWRIDSTSRVVDAAKAQLLTIICASGSPIVHYEEAPPDVGLLKEASSAASYAWHIPQGASGEDLLSWLYMGNWQLYFRATALQQIPDLCRASSADVRDFMSAEGIDLIIDAFHDNGPWTIGTLANDA